MIENYNPDVLTCLANLSNDEVFTPPIIANQMLDLLPAEIWRDKNATFLDPAAKSGVFLREIAKRLMDGLKDEIPDQQQRMDHIFARQLFGIAITDLTALLTRRSLYCSKKANGKYSICEGFDTPDGNVVFGRVIHIWEGNQCKYCGAQEEVMDAVTLVITALVAGLTGGLTETAQSAVKDLYQTLKARLQTKVEAHPDARQALESVTAKPESKPRQEVLAEELQKLSLEADGQLLELAKQLLEQLRPQEKVAKYQVNVQNSQGVTVGDKNEITQHFDAPPRKK